MPHQRVFTRAHKKYVPSWVGCQCSSRIAPGSTETSATAICVDTLNVVESTILTEPPLSEVGAICDIAKLNGSGTVPCGSEGATAFDGSGSVVLVSVGYFANVFVLRTRGEDVKL
jgi:hypothetical protein